MTRWFLVSLVALAAPLSAQDLDRAEALAREGRLEEARTHVSAWWNGPGAEGAPRSELQQALWLRGVLTLDPTQATLDYTRLVVEHPGSRFTDLALLRLGRIADATGDHRSARRYFEILRRDHPRSPVNAEAREWLDGHPAEAGDQDPPSRAPEVRPEPPRETPGSGGWAVQLGAFSESARAGALAERVRDAGFEPRLVSTPGTDLARVRVGRFPDPDRAREFRDRLRGLGFDALVVDDAAAERVVSG